MQHTLHFNLFKISAENKSIFLCLKKKGVLPITKMTKNYILTVIYREQELKLHYM